MISKLLTILVLLLSPSLLILHDSPPEVQNPNPKLKMTITVSDPQSDGLYLDNQWVHIMINIQNTSDEPIFLHVDGDFRSITPDSSKQLDILREEAKKLEPNESSPYKIDRVLFAGNYRLYVTSGVVNGTGTVKQFIGQDARGELYLTVSTQQDVLMKRTTDQNYLLMVITLFGVAGTGVGIYYNHRHNEKQRKDTKDYVDKQLTLQKESNDELRESNRLTRESLKLKQMELKSALGRPQIELVNTGLEYSGRSDLVRLYPNFRNDGKVPASNIKIYGKAFDRVVTLDEIVRSESEIKNFVIKVEGSISPGGSKNLNDANAQTQAIEWRKKDRPITVVVWITYQYLDNDVDEVMFSLQYTDTNFDNVLARYPYGNLEIIRLRLKSISSSSNGK